MKNWKRIVSVWIICVLIITGLSCSEPQEEVSSEYEDNIDTVFEERELPAGLTMTFTMSEDQPESLPSYYSGRIAEASMEEAIKKLLDTDNVVVEENVYRVKDNSFRSFFITAQGYKYIWGDAWYMYDLGRGIIYTEGTENNNNGYSLNHGQNDVYSKEKELSFMSREDCISEADALIQSWGISADLYQMYSMDAETMQKQYDNYISIESAYWEQMSDEDKTAMEQMQQAMDPIMWTNVRTPEGLQFTQEDERYLLLYRQKLSNVWIFPHFAGKDYFGDGTCGRIVFDHRGVLEADFRFFYEVVEKGKDTDIVSGGDCLNSYIQEYRVLLEPETEELRSMELYYISRSKGSNDENYTLIPVWVLEKRHYGQEGESLSEDEYTVSYIIWDAITGERYA